MAMDNGISVGTGVGGSAGERMANVAVRNYTKELVRDIYDKVVLGDNEMEWLDICDKHGSPCHPDTLRKAGVGIKMCAEAGCLNFNQIEANGAWDEYNANYGSKVQFYDQRREYNKTVRDDARAAHLATELVRAAQRLNEVKPLPSGSDRVYPSGGYIEGATEAVLVLSDWHYGMKADNIYNHYNTEIAAKRISYLRDEVAKKLVQNRISTLHVVMLGDMIDGSIHVTSRVAQEENTVEQIMHVSERVAELVSHLALYVDKLRVYSTFGNHARTIPNKKESIHMDNLERLIPFWMEQRFAHSDNIEVVSEDKGNAYELLGVNVLGHHLCGVHGDLDNSSSSPLMLSMLYERNFGAKPEYVLSGHLHSFNDYETLGITCIRGGSLCGSDEFAKNKRLFSEPEQTLLIFDENGLDSVHHIRVGRGDALYSEADRPSKVKVNEG